MKKHLTETNNDILDLYYQYEEKKIILSELINQKANKTEALNISTQKEIEDIVLQIIDMTNSDILTDN